MNAYLKNFVKVVVMLVFLVFVSLLSGCGTVYGTASDLESVASGVRRALDPYMEKRENKRFLNNDMDRERKIQQSLLFVGDHPDLLAKLKQREQNQ